MNEQSYGDDYMYVLLSSRVYCGAKANGCNYLLKRSMLKKTYSPLTKPSSATWIIISRTESCDAQNTTTANNTERIRHFQPLGYAKCTCVCVC